MSTNYSKLLIASILVLGGTAQAGTGGSAGRIRAAVQSGSQDAILAEVERAEYLMCPDCVNVVTDLLDDERPAVREVAAWWFARRPSVAQGFIDRSLQDLQGSDVKHARNGADFIAVFRNVKYIPALSTALARTDLGGEARAHAAIALGRIGDKSVDSALANAMKDGDAQVRLAAVQAWIAVRYQQGAAPVVQLVGDSDANVRAQAAAALGEEREASGRTNLEAALATDTDAVVRRNAAWALGRIGDAASRPALEKASTDPSPLVAMTAKAALSSLH
ncbi:MAG TPA: HEAT repeat domain-containing protein [Kofleriaceae bacterium]|jgi:HEAT repeat protein|nr:HEAT repeat domain-containing protein [Kofleriaceae bacterium]